MNISGKLWLVDVFQVMVRLIRKVGTYSIGFAIPIIDGVLFSSIIFSIVLHAADGQSASIPERETCPTTPPQTEGPYYPPQTQIQAQADTDNDLTQIKGEAGKPKGQILYVMGRVRDSQCRPIEGAVVEIWQASENGRYRHPRDSDNPQPLDPHFQYWGKSVTDKEGRYSFKTIKPRAYSIGPGRMRPSHIHFKVSHPSVHDFITQMYFVGDPYQDKDGILNNLPRAQRDLIIVPMEQPTPEYEQDSKIARFDLTLH
jgi:protocatechuate 3,4-dioxygenase beta subunit